MAGSPAGASEGLARLGGQAWCGSPRPYGASGPRRRARRGGRARRMPGGRGLYPLPNGPERDQVAAGLAEAGFEVQLGTRKADPDALPAAYRPRSRRDRAGRG